MTSLKSRAARRRRNVPIVLACILLIAETASAIWPLSSSTHPLSQCIDSWERDNFDLNLTKQENDAMCIGDLCWKNEALEAIKTVVRAYNDPETSIKPMFEKQFLEALFSSVLRKAGGPAIRPKDEPYAAVLAMLLSSHSGSRKGITSDQMMSAVTLSEEWIYGPYPPRLSVSGLGGHNVVPAGEYSLNAEGDEIGRASYISRNGTSEFHIGFDGRTRCWGIWHVKIKEQKKKQKKDDVKKDKEKEKDGFKRTDMAAMLDNLTSQANDSAAADGSSIGGGQHDADGGHGDRDEGHHDERAVGDECRRGVCRGRPLYRSCENTDLVPSTGWKSTKLSAYPIQVSPAVCRGSLQVMSFQQRTGSEVQWALLKETDPSKLDKGRPTGYLVFRGTADVHDVLTDVSIAKVHWLKDEGASWGVWSSIHSEVRSSISAIRRTIARSGLKTLIVTGHSLGGGYAQEAARQLKLSRWHFNIKVLVFGSPPIFARREGGECNARGQPLSWSPWDEVWPKIGHPKFGGKRNLFGRSCKAFGDDEFRRLDASTLHIVNRWDLVPRVHFLPHILSQEGGKHLVPAFTRLVASRIGGYAARFGGYITDALSLPQNFNRTMQSKRATLDLYTQLGEFVIYPPGIVCGTKEVSATAILPGLDEKDKAPVMGSRPPFQVAGVENAGADPLHAMAMDHAKYRDALKNHLVIRGVLDALCMQEWNVTCEALSKRFGSVKGGGLSAMQYELLVDWRERARERQEAEEERRRMAAEIARAEEMKRMGLVCESTAMHPWCILGGSDALVFDSWTLREEEDVLSICFDENADESTRMQVLGVAAALGRMAPHPSSAVGYHYHQGKGSVAGMVDDDVDFGDEVGGGFAGGDWPVH